MQVLTHDEIEYINSCKRLEWCDLPVLCYSYLQEVIFKNNPSDHEL